MGMKIVASAGQPFAAGSRVKFSVVGVDDATGQGSKEDRNCFWQATRLSGPPEKPVGFSVPQCVAMTDVVEFPVEPGVWILMAKNKGGRTVSFRYHVDSLQVEAKKPVPFSDMDPEFVLQRMRKAAGSLGRLESKFRCAPEVAENTAVATKSDALQRTVSRDSLKNSIDNLDRLLAKSRGTRRFALRAILSPKKVSEMLSGKARTLHAFASCIDGVWSITDWTSLGRQGSATVYSKPRPRYDQPEEAKSTVAILADLHGAISTWIAKWPYEEGYLSISGVVEGVTFSGGEYAETPGKDAAKLAGFLDAVSMITMFAGFVVPPLFLVSMVTGAGASAVRINESLKQGKGIEDNLLDVLFLVATATSVGKMAVGAASGMSRVASVATQVKGKSLTYMTWADDVANGACFVMMTPEVYDLTTETLSDDSLTASQKLERLATGLMPMVTMGGILIHQMGGKRIADFGKRVLDETMTVRPTELLPLEAHTNERTNKTKMGRKERKFKQEEAPARAGESEPSAKPESSRGPKPSHFTDAQWINRQRVLCFMDETDMVMQNYLRRNAADINADGFQDVLLHGGDKKVEVHKLGDVYHQNARVFAHQLREGNIPGNPNGKWNGGPIRLLSCSTGALPDGFAQELADALGVQVIAPTKDLWVFADGSYVSGSEDIARRKILPDGSVEEWVVNPPDGKMETFFPRDKKAN